VGNDRATDDLPAQLLQVLLRAIAENGVRRAALAFPADRTSMLDLSRELEFTVEAVPQDASRVRAVKMLQGEPGSGKACPRA
jgi:hypothetical protein